jgi:hypothetical protein
MKQMTPITLPDGFLETAASTAELAAMTASFFAGRGSPDGLLC